MTAVQLHLEGRARRVGDNVNTDYIIASTRKRDTLDESVLKRYLLEALDPDFAASVRPGDLLVAGRNFGCGSAMEVAATVIVAAGIRAVIAQTFARTFYRNAINNGLVPIECDTTSILEGDPLSIGLDGSGLAVTNDRTGDRVAGRPLPPIMLAILEAGGLAPYVRRHGGFHRPDTEGAESQRRRGGADGGNGTTSQRRNGGTEANGEDNTSRIRRG
jgi:3-isopropylmalate/(R)-2-methylmalate dehydratase small subunit